MSKNQKLTKKLTVEFIENCENFWTRDLENKNLDVKHKKIIEEFNKGYQNNIDLLAKNLINWKMQGDYGVPMQFSYNYFKNIGFKKSLIKLIKYFSGRMIHQTYDTNLSLDDYEILKMTGANELLSSFPAHKNPFFDDYFFLEKNISTTPRWSRYLYIANKLKKDLLNNESSWLDIGSYYGGLQSIIKKIYPGVTIFMVDFNHQLLRSYVYLKSIFPENNHSILNPNNKNDFKDVSKGSIVYINSSDFFHLDQSGYDLVTNFFSFGEMKDEEFSDFYNSKVVNNSKNIYLCNRFVSSPFFERTYKNKINITNYLKTDFKIEYLDVFPIHNYSISKRNIFGRISKRPYGSQSFELHLKNSKIV